MTDFRKWDKFDADAAEEEVERKAEDEEVKRRRIAEEQRALKSCQDRAARLKSEAVVRALKAKRGSRRRPTATSTGCDGGNSSRGSIEPLGGKSKDDPASLARASADEADVILAGLRKGLALRDEVVAATEAGELHRGVCKAREGVLQLDAAQTLLLKATASTDDDGDTHAQAGGGGHNASGTCCGGGGHDHSHAHAHAHEPPGHTHGGSGGHGGARCAGDKGGGGVGIEKSGGAPEGRREEEEAARREMAAALEVLRRARAACRVAEAACLLRGGRTAESTETLRDLLLEDPKGVPAWVARGESFLALDAPLLAGLHFDRALELDPGCTAAARHKENLRRLLSDAFASAAHAATAIGGGADCSIVEVGHGGCGDDPKKRVAVADGACDGSPAPADEGAVCYTGIKSRTGAVAGVAPIDLSSRVYGGRRETGTGDGDDNGATAGGGSATAFGRAVAAACENYRAGVVLHQEAFLSSSTEKFLRVLELLEVATAEMKAAAVPQGLEGEPGDGIRKESVDLSCKHVGGGEEFQQNGAGGLAGDGAGIVTSSSSSRRESLGRGAEVIRSLRVGCHLNIAAAFLLRKTDFESAVDHCTRALFIQPGNSRALVRRAQAYQELGLFRLSVEDLEAAEASVSVQMRHACHHGEETEGERAEAHAGELAEVVKRLEHARWTKVHVGNGKDELPYIPPKGRADLAVLVDSAL
eukprot:g1317.t1